LNILYGRIYIKGPSPQLQTTDPQLQTTARPRLQLPTMFLSSVALASLAAAVAQSYIFAPEQGSALGPGGVREGDGSLSYDPY
jgi:hypothetical protein